MHTIRTKCKLASAYLCCFCQKKQERLRKALLFCEIIYIFSINLISISDTRIWRAMVGAFPLFSAVDALPALLPESAAVGWETGCWEAVVAAAAVVSAAVVLSAAVVFISCRAMRSCRSRRLTCLVVLSYRSFSCQFCGGCNRTISFHGSSCRSGSGTVSLR